MNRDRWVDVIVEIPKGSRNKYEFDPASGRMRLDRVLFAAVHYPADYGFIPDTLAGDGDTLDALVLIDEATFPGCVISARPIGMLVMSDEKGVDEKVLCVPQQDPVWTQMRTLSDLPDHMPVEIAHFFTTYKLLEQKATEVVGWEGPEAAWRVIEEARRTFEQGT